MALPTIDRSWSLFLDRDGVINRRLPGDYVRDWEAFEWLPGALEAIAGLTQRAGRSFVVTNQQGIGKGLMTEQSLALIHALMQQEITVAGGRIDAVYHCPDLSSAFPNCRKPGPAMAMQAKRAFPDVDFRRSVMVGDSLSDMQFGQALGMYTVLVTGKTEEQEAFRDAVERGLKIDARCGSLYEFYTDLPL
ncbi:MAG: HAD family hydrolase [Phaeodactylibacter sp.]|nr:HAD family hydrolase [Phaeodactylibacter sp.]MCB9052125.1 HAD family hydrolase [Lewinellaceae bacterium]